MSKDTITTTFTREELVTFTEALSDVLCWGSGFCAGRENSSDHPLGLDALRDLNIKLKNKVYDLRDINKVMDQ